MNKTAKTKVSSTKYFELEEMQGQTLLFFAAGYETSSATLSLFAHYLALNPEVQAKLQREIDEHFPKPGENIHYDTIQRLSYLEMVFCELSRLSGLTRSLQRMSRQQTTVGDVVIPTNAKAIVNVADIHLNPDLWGPEPVDQLIPERFLPQRKVLHHPMAYLPFGEGPRNCIGMRFAIMQVKMVLINILQRYTILTCTNTQVPLPRNMDGACTPRDGVFVKLKRR